MRALTLTQPWCGLVASGIKLVENRGKPVIANADIVRGPVEVALHASRETSQLEMRRIVQIAPELCIDMDQPWIRLASITSAIIAVATVYQVLYIGGCSRSYIVDLCDRRGIPEQARWMFGPTSYLLRPDVRVLAEPVPCRGWQGFWKVPPDVETRVVAQIGRP